jgi:hypothetical protein
MKGVACGRRAGFGALLSESWAEPKHYISFPYTEHPDVFAVLIQIRHVVAAG